jgi:hypothetical protein
MTGDNRMTSMIFGKLSSQQYQSITIITVMKSFLNMFELMNKSVKDLLKEGYLTPESLYSGSKISTFLKEVPVVLNTSVTIDNIQKISTDTKKYIEMYRLVHCDAISSGNNLVLGKVEQFYNALLLRENELREILSGQSVDVAPYVYMVNGNSAVGKTTVVEYISSVVKVAYGIDINLPSTYIIQNLRGKPWMLNYHEFTSAECRFDDMGQFTEDPEGMTLFLQISGNLVTCAPNPEADKMGKHKVRPKLVSVTSNVGDVSMKSKFCFAHQDWRCPAAFARRFHCIVDAQLRDEFKDANGALDKTKCNSVQGMADAWLITIYEPILQPLAPGQKSFEQDVVFNRVRDKVSIFEAAVFIRQHALGVRKQQLDMISKLNAPKDISQYDVCEHNTIRGGCLRCYNPQAIVSASMTECTEIAEPHFENHFRYYHFRLKFWHFLDLRMLRQKSPYPNNPYKMLYHRRHRILYNFWCGYTKVMPKPMVYGTMFTILLCYGMYLRAKGEDETYVQGVQEDIRYYIRRADRRAGHWLNTSPAAQAGLKTVCFVISWSINFLVFYGIGVGIKKLVTKKEPKAESKSRDTFIPTAQDERNLEVRYRETDSTNTVQVRNLALRDSTLPNNANQLDGMIRDNVFSISIEVGGVRRCNIAIYVHGHICMTVKHMFRGIDWTKGEQYKLTFQSFVRDKYHRDHTEVLTGQNFFFLEDKDVVFIRTVTCKNKSRINLFPDDKMLAQSYYGKAFIKQYYHRTDFEVTNHDIMVGPQNSVTYQLGASNDTYTVSDVYTGEVPCKDGNCGSPLIASELPKCFILGIVIASNKNNDSTYFQVVRKSEVLNAISQLNTQNKDLGTSRALEMPIFTTGYEPRINKKSELCFVEGDAVGHVNILGCVPNLRGPQKPSMVEPTMISPIGDLHHCGPALKHGIYRELNAYYKPYWNMIELSTESPIVPLGSLRICGEDVFDTFINNIGVDYIKDNVKCLTIEEAVFGCDSVAYINKINGNASSGDPFYKLNSTFYDMETRSVSPILVDQIHTLRQLAVADKSPCATFNVLLKDEVVKVSKRFKPRLFTGGSLPLLILSKQVLGSICRLIMLNRMKFETVQGLNTESHEWHDLYLALTKFGKSHIVAGDFSKFDKKVHKYALRLAFWVLKRLCVLSGNYSEDDLAVIDLVIDAITDPVYNLYGTLFMLPCGEPSGHFLTTIINSIVVSMYIRMAWFHEYGSVREFRDEVSLFTMGDDHIMGVRNSHFGFNVIKQKLGDCGILYTGNDKEGNDPPNQENIDNCDFLKRKFVFQDYPFLKYGIMSSPIEMLTISKVLNYYVKTSAMTSLEHTRECAFNALEFLVHHGETVYNNMAPIIFEKMWRIDRSFPYTSYEALWDKIATRRAYSLGFTTDSAVDNDQSSDNMARSDELFLSNMDNMNNNSGDATLNTSTPIKTGDMKQNTVFVDNAGIVTKTYPKGSQDGLLCSIQPMSELSEFFRRPLKIASIEWKGTDAPLDKLLVIDPWASWLSDSPVQNKLQSYRNFRGNMHIRVVINSNKFYYGTVAMYYEPLFSLNTQQVRSVYTSGSQCPGVRFGTSHNFSQEMELPFVWISDWLDLTSASTGTRTPGRLTFQVINELRNINDFAVATDKVEISVYSWIENIQLSGPSSADILSQAEESELDEASG